MRLYHCPQVSQNVGLRNRRERVRWTVPPQQQLSDREQQEDTELRSTNPVLAHTQPHQSLHQELLFCYRRGLLPKKKPELQSVLERKRREERVRRDILPLSDLERHLQTRRLRLGTLETEDEKRRRQQNEPEFVRVKGALRHIPGFCL